jgi:hypothetical protein
MANSKQALRDIKTPDSWFLRACINQMYYAVKESDAELQASLFAEAAQRYSSTDWAQVPQSSMQGDGSELLKEGLEAYGNENEPEDEKS